MALPILDGNQTAATLSTIITGGAHIPAHTVVSLGSQAISDITSGVSGSVVSISNFPSTQTVAGTVTANARSDIYDGANDVYWNKSVVAWGNPFLGEPTLVEQSTPLPISGTVTANLPVTEAWAGIYDNGNDCIKIELANLNGDTLSPSNPLPISGTVTANLSSSNLNSVTIGVRGTVTVGNSVTIGSLPAISGTVTANVDFAGAHGTTPPSKVVPIAYIDTLNTGNLVHVGSDGGEGLPSAIRNIYVSGVGYADLPSWLDGSSSLNVPISGTVTVGALPSGSLTTRFGSVTTANTAQITSAVTNTSRKYLLAQNISAETVTIGIGFSPTTTQGIQLTAGGGLTFDAFCPTGAVYWLGAVTGAAFTILEG